MLSRAIIVLAVLATASVLVIAAAPGASSPAKAGDSCSVYSWPYYPTECLTEMDGSVPATKTTRVIASSEREPLRIADTRV
jgi:hypothetical protein